VVFIKNPPLDFEHQRRYNKNASQML